MWTIEELIKMETPYLTIRDITNSDWEQLDYELEKYDRAKENYNLTISRTCS